MCHCGPTFCHCGLDPQSMDAGGMDCRGLRPFHEPAAFASCRADFSPPWSTEVDPTLPWQTEVCPTKTGAAPEVVQYPCAVSAGFGRLAMTASAAIQVFFLIQLRGFYDIHS